MARKEAPELAYQIVPELAKKNGRVSWNGTDHRIEGYSATRPTRTMLVFLTRLIDGVPAQATFKLPKGYRYEIPQEPKAAISPKAPTLRYDPEAKYRGILLED